MLGAAFYGLPHSESEVYCLKVSAIGRQPRAEDCTGRLKFANSNVTLLE